MKNVFISFIVFASFLLQNAALAFEGGDVFKVESRVLAPIEVSANTDLRVLGRGIYDRETQATLILVCKDAEQKNICERGQFVLIRPDHRAFYLDKPFFIRDYEKTKNDLFLSWVASTDLERASLFIEHTKKLKNLPTVATAGEGVKPWALVFAGFGIHNLSTAPPAYWILGLGLITPAFLLWAAAPTIFLIERLDHTIDTADFKRFFSFQKMGESLLTVTQTDRIHWQFKPKKSHPKTFKAILSLLTPDDRILSEFTPANQCRFSKVELVPGKETTKYQFYDYYANIEAETLRAFLPRKISKKLPKAELKALKFPNQKWVEERRIETQRFALGFLRLAMDYTPEDSSAPTLKLHFQVKERSGRTKIKVELEGATFNDDKKTAKASAKNKFSHWHKLVSRMSDCQRTTP